MSRAFESWVFDACPSTLNRFNQHDFASKRNDGGKALSRVLLHVIRLGRVAQLIVSRRVAGTRVGLLAILLAYHFDVAASIPRYLVIKILPVLVLKPAIPSRLRHDVFQSPPSCEQEWLVEQEGKKKKGKLFPANRSFARCYSNYPLFDVTHESEDISWDIRSERDRLKFVSGILKFKNVFFFFYVDLKNPEERR